LRHLQSVSQNFSKQFLLIFGTIFSFLSIRYFKFIIFSLISCTLYLIPLTTYAAQVTLAWDTAAGSVAGYQMHYGTTSGNYDYSVDVGNSTSCTISGLQEGDTYYFAVTAYNGSDESDYSDEINYRVPSDNSAQQSAAATANPLPDAGATYEDAGDGTTYEDAQDGTTKGWDIYDTYPGGASIKNVYDSERQSRVIQLTGSETENGYRLRSDNGKKWENSDQFTIQWSMKYSEEFTVYIEVETTAGRRFLVYEPVDYDNLGSGTYARYGLGRDVTDRRWHTFTRDLQADLADAQRGARILEVNGFLIRGSGKVDDIILLNQ